MIARLKFVLIALLSLYSIKASAQSIHFTYDNTGNRTARSYYAPASRAKGSTPLFNDDSQIKNTIPYIAISVSNNLLTVTVINNDGKTASDFSVSTPDGIMIDKGRINSTVTCIDLSGYKSAVYIVSIMINGQPKTWKITKQ